MDILCCFLFLTLIPLSICDCSISDTSGCAICQTIGWTAWGNCSQFGNRKRDIVINCPSDIIKQFSDSSLALIKCLERCNKTSLKRKEIKTFSECPVLQGSKFTSTATIITLLRSSTSSIWKTKQEWTSGSTSHYFHSSLIHKSSSQRSRAGGQGKHYRTTAKSNPVNNTKAVSGMQLSGNLSNIKTGRIIGTSTKTHNDLSISDGKDKKTGIITEKATKMTISKNKPHVFTTKMRQKGFSKQSLNEQEGQSFIVSYTRENLHFVIVATALGTIMATSCILLTILGICFARERCKYHQRQQIRPLPTMKPKRFL